MGQTSILRSTFLSFCKKANFQDFLKTVILLYVGKPEKLWLKFGVDWTTTTEVIKEKPPKKG